MKIKKNSWHYRLTCKLQGDRVSKDLCTYCRILILNLFLLSILIAAISFSAVAIAYVPLSHFFGWSHEHFLYEIGGITICVNALVMAFFTFMYFRSHRDTDKPDSLVVSWVKAKKAKYCPYLEFTDD